MDTNLYALEKQVQARLGDARAAGARATLISSLREERRARVSILAIVAAMWTGRRRLQRRASAGASET
jgi:hypothetical protein